METKRDKNHDRDRDSEESGQELGLRFDDRITNLFGVDRLASNEYHRAYSRRLLSPEEQLMIAVLEDAVADFMRYMVSGDRKGQKRFADAEAWILDDGTDWVFSFVNCCEVLGLEPNCLRAGLLQWRQRMFSRPRSPSALPPVNLTGKKFRAAA